MLASQFGLVPVSPRFVVTGCDRRVPYAMTSQRPEGVTCLACRDHAYREHLRFARTMEASVGLAGSVAHGEDALARARHHRDLARRFGREDR
jgi:hypothetical protein